MQEDDFEYINICNKWCVDASPGTKNDIPKWKRWFTFNQYTKRKVLIAIPDSENSISEDKQNNLRKFRYKTNADVKLNSLLEIIWRKGVSKNCRQYFTSGGFEHKVQQ